MTPAERIMLAVFGLVFAVLLVLILHGCDSDVPPEPFTPLYPPCDEYALPDVHGDIACLHPKHTATDVDGGMVCRCPVEPSPKGICNEATGWLHRCPGDSDGGGE